MVDPPWPQGEQENRGNNQDAAPYSGLTIKELCKIPVQEMAHEDCILWLWTTNARMRNAFRLLDAWEFKERTILTWIKDSPNWGRWLRDQSEHCILSYRGKAKIKLCKKTTVLEASKKDYLQKPDEFYELVEEVCAGSKLEIFAQRHREGWERWEPELPSQVKPDSDSSSGTGDNEIVPRMEQDAV